MLIELDGRLHRDDGALGLLLKVHQEIFVLLLMFGLFGPLVAFFSVLVLIQHVLIFFVILRQLIAEVKRNAIELDVIFIDRSHNLSHLIRREFGGLFSICDQEDSLPVLLRAYEAAEHIHSYNKAVEDVALFLLGFLGLESLDMSEEIQVDWTDGPLGCHVFIFTCLHLIV